MPIFLKRQILVKFFPGSSRVSSGMVISIGTPGAAKSQGVVGVIVLAGVLSVGVALDVATALNVLIGGGLVAVSSLASVNRASIVWYTWVAFIAGVSAVCPLGRLQLVRNIMVISVHKIGILRIIGYISILVNLEGGLVHCVTRLRDLCWMPIRRYWRNGLQFSGKFTSWQQYSTSTL